MAVEPLRSCITQLELVAQLLLPLPNISLLGENTGDISQAKNGSDYDEAQQKLDLPRIITAHRNVTRSIIAPLNGDIGRLDSIQVNAFQTELRRWRGISDHLFQYCDEEPGIPSVPLSSWVSLEELPMPPRPQYFPSVETAITVALYNCFVAHTMWLFSITTDTSHPCEISAYLYVYQNLRIAEGLLSGNPKRKDEERYFPSESLNIGLSSILYLTAQCCYGPTWQQWIVDKLRYIGQEGLFNSVALATCLDMLKSYQHTQKKNVLSNKGDAWQSQSPLGPPISRTIPTVIPEPDGKRFTAYYMQIPPGYHSPSGFQNLSLEVVGRASWRVEDSDSSEQKRSVDIHTSHLGKKQISDLSLDLGVQSNSWETLLNTPASQMTSGIEDYIFDDFARNT